MTVVQFLRTHHSSRSIVHRLGEPRARLFIEQFERYLNTTDSILDVGTGVGNIAAQLIEKGYTVLPLDVENLSFTSDVVPKLFDGKAIPFNNKQFDVALVSTVLHHVKVPKDILLEAARVAKKLIVIEDIYTSTPHKYLTYAMDSLMNLEFKNHPHSNKTDSQWKNLFREMGLELVSTGYMKSSVVFKHAVYVLETKGYHAGKRP